MVGRMRKSSIKLFCTVLIVFFVIPILASAATVTVDDDGPADYASIRDAVSHALTGDTVLVNPGTYHENVDVDKQLTIISTDGALATSVVPVGTYDGVFHITADSVIISGFNLSDNPYGAAIYVENSDNSTLTDNIISGSWYGIHLGQSSNNNLSSNTFLSSNVKYDIFLSSSSNNELTNNTFLLSNSNPDIYLYDSNNNILRSNTVSGGGGICLDSSNNNDLSNNTIDNSRYGIYLEQSGNNIMTNNIVSNNYDGIYLGQSSNNIMTNNIVLNNSGGYGISVRWFSNNNTLTSNIVSKAENNGILLAYCSNNNLASNKVSDNSGTGIYMAEVSNNMLTGNTASNNTDFGIYLVQSSINNTFTSNTVSNNAMSGIYMDQSSNNTLASNYVSRNYYGINLCRSNNNNILTSNVVSNNSNFGILLSSSNNNNILNSNIVSNNINSGIFLSYSLNNNNTFTGNMVSGNSGQGISLSGPSTNNTLTSNVISDNSDYGIYLGAASTNMLVKNTVSNNTGSGIFLNSGSTNNLTSNVLSKNTGSGIYLLSSINNSLISNQVSNNTDSGIYLSSGSRNNLIYNNVFNNAVNVAFAGTTGNVWNITKTTGINIMGGPFLGGNFWSCPDGTGFSQIHMDIDADGICDESYTIESDNIDLLPLTNANELLNDEHPYVHLKSLSSLKTVDNVNASYSVGILNGQSKEDTFDLVVINHDTSSVASLNQSSITLQPWEEREVVLNVTDETIGEYFVTVEATSRSNASITDEVTTKTTVQESFSLEMSSQQGTVTSIGANITYLLNIRNNQKYPDTLTINSDGIDPSWIFYDTTHQLSAGEQKTVPISLMIPDNASVGTYELKILVTSSNFGTVRSAALPLVVQSGPVLSYILPENNTHLGSDDVIFSWVTNVNSTTGLVLNQSGVETVYTGDNGIYHNVVVTNLARNQRYTYRVISNTSHGSTQSEERDFYIDNGIIFTQKTYNFTIERDYDQRVTIAVENTDSSPHEVLLTANSTNPEFIVGFVGEGSSDTVITLAPLETKDIILALHAQDAYQEEYHLLLDLTTEDNITDNAIANISVRQPNIDLRCEELSVDPLTLTKTLRITNHGDSITDLNIYASGELKGNVTFDPVMTHGYLTSGSSTTIEVMPSLSLDFAGMEGDIVAETAGVSRSFPVNFTLPEGMEVYYGSVPNITVEFTDYFDNDDSPNTNPMDDALVESYLTNGTLIFFTQIIVDVYQDGEPVSDANVTLKAWNSKGKTILLNGVSDIGGKALFTVYGQADDYSYKAIVEDYNVETEVRNFSVDSVNYLFEVHPDTISWSVISDSNSSFYDFSAPVVLDSAPFSITATKDIIEPNESFILDMRWEFDPLKQVTILGFVDGNNITFNTEGIPFGNYTATILSTFNNSISFSEPIDIAVTDVNGMQNVQNYSFWTPFPVNETYMATLNIQHEVLSEDPTITLDLNDVGTNNGNKSEYLFEYYILSNETKTENVNITVSTPQGLRYSSQTPVSLETDVPTYINISIPVNYPDGTRIESMNLSASAGTSELNINVTPKIQYIYEKRIWVGADYGIYAFIFDQLEIKNKSTQQLIKCGGSIGWNAFLDFNPYVKASKGLEYAVNTVDWYVTFEEVTVDGLNNDFNGLVEDALKKAVDVTIDAALELSPGYGTVMSVMSCFDDWHDAISEVAENPDIRDIGINQKYSLNNAYCTNNPNVKSCFVLDSMVKPSMSPTPNIEDVYLVEDFSLPWSRDSYRPHTVNISINGEHIATLNNTIPEGNEIFSFDSSLLNYADDGTASNTIGLETTHLNGGHYIVASNMKVIIPMKKMGMYVVADSQSSANKVIAEMSNTFRNIADLGVYVENINFSNPSPVAGEQISINTTIFNLGTNGAILDSLQLLDNGVQIGDDIDVGYIPLMNSVPVNFTWTPTSGSHTITIRVNYDRQIEESDYSNNEASTTITVAGEPDAVPPLSITDLVLQAAGSTRLDFVWTNPTDSDFSHTEVYLDDIFKANISDEEFNIDGLQPATNYTISTHTVDIYGNVNQTWINLTARTQMLTEETFANFTANTTSGYAPLTVQFTDLSVNAKAWEWDFGDGTNSTERNPLHTYLEEGNCTVSLNVSSQAGYNSATKVDYIIVADWNPWNDPASEGGKSITLSELQTAIYDWRFGIVLSTGEMVDLSRLQGLIYSWRFG